MTYPEELTELIEEFLSAPSYRRLLEIIQSVLSIPQDRSSKHLRYEF